MREPAWLFPLILVFGMALPAAAQEEPAGEVIRGFPPAGVDEFPISIAQIGIDVTLDGIPEGDINAEGPFVVVRSDPRPEGGVNVIDVEIVQMELRGSSPLGPVLVRESPELQSRGQIRAQSPESDFPADSFFDVFVEIEIGEVTVVNREPIRLEAVITEIPPRITVYRSFAQPPVVPLFLRGSSQIAALLLHVAHAPNPDFEITLRDLKILIERVQLKIEALSQKVELLDRTQTVGFISRLLLPFNVSGGGFETGVAISNITNQFPDRVAGGIRFQLVPLENPSAQIFVDTTTLAAAGLGVGLDAGGNVPPGGTYSVLLAELLRGAGVSGPFRGQIFATCFFPAAQGINFIADSGFTRQSQGYPAVIIR